MHKINVGQEDADPKMLNTSQTAKLIKGMFDMGFQGEKIKASTERTATTGHWKFLPKLRGGWMPGAAVEARRADRERK